MRRTDNFNCFLQIKRRISRYVQIPPSWYGDSYPTAGAGLGRALREVYRILGTCTCPLFKRRQRIISTRIRAGGPDVKVYLVAENGSEQEIDQKLLD